MFLLIDNYDSFSHNLAHFLGELGAEVVMKRNDALTVDEALALRPAGIVISPGPGRPESAGVAGPLAAAATAAGMALLGVCLGHQAIGQALGAQVVAGPAPVHGKVSLVRHNGDGIFAGLPDPLAATRYHSLVLDPDSLPDGLAVTARTGDGTIMGIRHRTQPVHGVQFHPESIATEAGHALLANFIALATGHRPAIPETHRIAEPVTV